MVKAILPSIFNEYFQNISYYQKKLKLDSFNDEDIHQLRINLRKVVSLIDFFQEYFPKHKLKKKRKFLKQLISLTNKKRDLDVFKIVLKDQVKYIGVKKKKNLLAMIEVVEDHSQIQKKSLRDTFSKKDVIYKLKKTIVFFNEKKNYRKSFAKKDVHKVFQSHIKKQLRRIFKDIKHLKINSHAHDYHKLRIKFKKLRYVTETYYMLCPSSELKKMIKQVKKMQTNFGQYQDCYVHQHLLLTLFDESTNKIVNEINQNFIKTQSNIKQNIIKYCKIFQKIDFI